MLQHGNVDDVHGIPTFFTATAWCLSESAPSSCVVTSASYTVAAPPSPNCMPICALSSKLACGGVVQSFHIAFRHTLFFNSTVQVESLTRHASCGTNEIAVALSRSKEPLGKQLKTSSIASIGEEQNTLPHSRVQQTRKDVFLEGEAQRSSPENTKPAYTY